MKGLHKEKRGGEYEKKRREVRRGEGEGRGRGGEK